MTTDDALVAAVSAETLADELSRLLREWDEAEEEAWNLIADFTVVNSAEILSALSRKQLGGVTVKPLEWEEPCPKNNQIWIARTMLGEYCIHIDGGRHMAWLETVHNSRIENWDGPERVSLFEAQHDAQADYERRIMSALDLGGVSVDLRPDLGAETPEPSLRSLVEDYYLAHFPPVKATSLAERYIAALSTETPPVAPAPVVTDGIADRMHDYFVENGEWVPPKRCLRAALEAALAVPAQGEITVPARDGIESQRGLNDVFPGDPYPATAQLKRGLDKLRAEASRGPVSSREIFNLTDPLMDILARTGNRT